MKRKLHLKPFVIPISYTIFVFVLLTSVFFVNYSGIKEDKDDITYVSSTMTNDVKPVINLESMITRPYQDSNIKIGIDYYNKDDNEENQGKSIVYYSNTYMPNSGVDYILDNQFSVYSVLDGEVIDIKEEELLGKTITIRHDTNLISVYQGLSDIKVSKNEQVLLGQEIGTSGTNKLNSDLGNHLHFELIYKGQTVDPEDYFDKKISELE